MIAALDSATPPSPAQIAAARAAGIRVWGGYLSTAPFDGLSHFGLLRPWSQGEFAAVKALSGVPIAFASGWDDPAGCKLLAASWGVRLCVDVEPAIRGNGPWLQAWLDASGAGLYSFADAFPGRVAAFAILADRSRTPPDPKATWPGWHPQPAMPCGWQWEGTHNEFGVTVDRLWLDEWFAPHTQEVTMPALIRSADPAHTDAHGTGSVYLLDGNRKRWIPGAPAPLDNFRWVDQVAAALGITGGDAHHVTDVDNQVLDLFPEDSAGAAFPTKLSGAITATLSP
jgi:hypothetical protein